MVRFKEECPHRIDCPLGRKPGGSTRAEEKPLRDTACRLRRKGLDMPCDSYWGWLSWFYRTLSHFVSFKNRNHWPQVESCFKSSSDHGTLCIKLDFTFVIDPPLMMAQSRAESTRDTYNYGQYINQFPTNTIKVIREFEQIQKKICRHKMSIMFNEICINEEMLPKYTYIYIYIYVCVCICVCVSVKEYELCRTIYRVSQNRSKPSIWFMIYYWNKKLLVSLCEFMLDLDSAWVQLKFLLSRFFATMHVKDQVLGNVFGGTFSGSFRQDLSPHPHCKDTLLSTSSQIWENPPSW